MTLEQEIKIATKKLAAIKNSLPRGAVKRDLRGAGKIAANIAKQNAPVSTKAHYRYSTPKASSKFRAPKGEGVIAATYEPGNLRDSIGVMSFRGSTSVFVGPRTGKKSKGNDGYYAQMVEFGTKYTAPNPFMRRSAAQSEKPVQNELIKRFRKRIEKAAQ